jgi:cobalt-zinc-cadmium efflux system protein
MGVGHSHHHRHPEGAGAAPNPFGDHEHGDSHWAHRSRAGGTRALAISVALTLGYALVELVGGLWAGSLALLADAGHMATDSAALLFALAANLIARRPVSDRHSFGLARVEVIAAFVNALAMLAVVVWITVEAIARLGEPIPVKGAGVFAIAAVGLLINLAVAWALSRDRENVNTRAALIHVIGDLLGSVAAIVAGLVIAAGGPVMVDPLLSMFVAALILRSTFGVLRQSTLVLLDSVPEGVDYNRVGRSLAQVPGIVAVHDLHVWSMVPGRGALSAHVLIEDIEQWPVVLHQVRHILRRDFGIDHITLQPEWLRRDAPAGAIPISATATDGTAITAPAGAAGARDTR